MIIIMKMKTAQENVDAVVVGYPKQMNNQASESVRFINPFLKKFQQKYPEIKLEIYDERFTSKMAFQTMIDGGLKKQKRQDKALVDAISATIILQNYLKQSIMFVKKENFLFQLYKICRDQKLELES